MALLIIGVAFKIAAAPFHFWTPDVYDGAPLPITAFMSACVRVAAFATVTRVLLEALPGAAANWHRILWWLAALTMVAGNVLALSQRNLVRMLAYSSIAHAGYLLVTVLVASAAGTGALVFYGVSYTLATMGAFAVLVAVNGGRDQAPTIDDVAGLWLVRPWMAGTLAVCLLAFLGMPLVGGMGFFAKWYVLQAALQAKAPQTVLSIVLVVSSAVSAAYYLSVITAMFMRPRSETAPSPHVATSSRLLMVSVVVALLLLGVYPTPLRQLARRATVDTTPATPAAPGDAEGPVRLQTASTITRAPILATH
jgi:NADH-quinone oxidoreductase subunit N